MNRAYLFLLHSNGRTFLHTYHCQSPSPPNRVNKTRKGEIFNNLLAHYSVVLSLLSIRQFIEKIWNLECTNVNLTASLPELAVSVYLSKVVKLTS